MSCRKQKPILIPLIMAAMSFCCSPQEAERDYECPDCNVILIIVDTLRADHLGCYGYSVEETALTINGDKRDVLFEHPDGDKAEKSIETRRETSPNVDSPDAHETAAHGVR